MSCRLGEQFKCGETYGDSTNPEVQTSADSQINRRSRPLKRRNSGFPMLGRRTSPDSHGTNSPSAPRRTPILTNRQRTPDEAPRTKRTKAATGSSAKAPLSGASKNTRLPRI